MKRSAYKTKEQYPINLKRGQCFTPKIYKEGKFVNTKYNNKNLFQRILIWLGRVTLVLAVIASGIFLWAFSATDTSLIARGIMWGDADVGDLNRFPSRRMRASEEPFYFGSVADDLLPDLPITNPDVKAENMPFETYMELTNTTAFIVLHGNQVLYEGYYNGFGPELIQTSLSLAKSYVSTLVGIAIEEGFIGDLDDRITIYLPELLEKDSRFGEITIRHLITMSSGIGYQDITIPINDGFITYYAPDLRAAALDIEIERAPGKQFHYNNYNTLLMGMILERSTGMTVSEYMETRLWQPMGAEGDGFWSLDSEQSGFEKMESGVNGRPIDLIKLGWLFLNDGKNGDQQVVPESWVEEATRLDTTTDRSANYQYYWWIDTDRQAYYAEGNLCQFIYVYPKADLVLARFGTDCGGTGFIGLMGNIALWLETQLID